VVDIWMIWVVKVRLGIWCGADVLSVDDLEAVYSNHSFYDARQRKSILIRSLPSLLPL
jgi:hypothetical protein